MSRINKTIISVAILASLVSTHSFGQVKTEPQLGTISFVTSSRVYVKFTDTQSILVGDTLYLITEDGPKAGLIVDQKSSLSVVGKPLDGVTFSKGDILQFNGRILIKEEDVVAKPKKVFSRKNDQLDGSISIANYSNISSATDFNTRSVARVRLSADEIKGSNFSFDSYLLYRQNLESSESGVFQSPGLFNVYGLSIKYEKEDNYSISIGRKINRRVASLGMMDGVHAEKQFGKSGRR